jgi:hypothetical protein
MDDQTRKRIKNQLNEVEKFQEILNDKTISWYKNLLTISIAFLGIIFSLKTKECESYCLSIIFKLIISTLSLGILFGVIFLYGEVSQLNQRLTYHRDKIVKLRDGIESEELIELQRKSIYGISEKICKLLLGLTLPLLVIYSFLKF